MAALADGNAPCLDSFCAQVIILFQPAGSIEEFFKRMSKQGKDIPRNQEVVLKELWEQHGMEVLGPPLDI